MAYAVRITSRAERDLDILYESIQASASDSASRWYAGLNKAIQTLAAFPFLCPVTPEDKSLRHLIYGKKRNSFRVIYGINVKRREVTILHIRHGARRKFRRSDLAE